MNDLTRRDGGDLPHIPSFGGFEKLVIELAQVRLAIAEAIIPTQALLDQVEAVLSRVEPIKAQLDDQKWAAPLPMVATYLGLLLKAYPNAGSQDARVFGRLLRDDVHSLDASVAAIEIACRRWRQKSKFLPAISELMAEVRLAKSEIDGAREFAARLPALRARLLAELDRG